MKHKIGIVDVGGGMRGVYAAGVFDFCLDAGLHFDLELGFQQAAPILHPLRLDSPTAISAFSRSILSERNIWGLEI